MSNPQSQAGQQTTHSEILEHQDATKPEPTKKPFLALGSDQPLYLPLVDAQVIRLVELAPGAWNDQVKIRIFITELEHAPQYDAISYVWGDPRNTVPITCNGRQLDVTVNLNLAFKRVRLTCHPRIVWADAVCIR